LWVRIDESDVSVAYAIAILQKAAAHLRTLVYNINDEKLMVEQFRELIELREMCIDSFALNHGPLGLLESAFQNILKHTTLKNFFRSVSPVADDDAIIGVHGHSRAVFQETQGHSPLPSVSVSQEVNLLDLPKVAWINSMILLGRLDMALTIQDFRLYSEGFDRICSKSFFDGLNAKMGWYGNETSWEAFRKSIPEEFTGGVGDAEDWFNKTSQVYQKIYVFRALSGTDENEYTPNHPLADFIKLQALEDDTVRVFEDEIEVALIDSIIWLGRPDMASVINDFRVISNVFDRICSKSFFDGLNAKMGWYGNETSWEAFRKSIPEEFREGVGDAEDWFNKTSEVYQKIYVFRAHSGTDENEYTPNHPLADFIKLQAFADDTVRVFEDKIEVLKQNSTSSGNWGNWVVVDRDDPAVIQAISNMNMAKKHLQTAVRSIENEELLVQEFRKLIALRKGCVDSFGEYNLPPAMLVLEEVARKFLYCTTLKNEFKFDYLPDGKSRFSEIGAGM
jgi:hypothetical protein